jgi:hypothetical protein
MGPLTTLFAQKDKSSNSISLHTYPHSPGTHLNFFKGFEYDPTVVCAMTQERSVGLRSVQLRG